AAWSRFVGAAAATVPRKRVWRGHVAAAVIDLGRADHPPRLDLRVPARSRQPGARSGAARLWYRPCPAAGRRPGATDAAGDFRVRGLERLWRNLVARRLAWRCRDRHGFGAGAPAGAGLAPG